MPRFEQEGFDPRRRRENDALDRTVPEEDRHLDPEVDLDFNRRQRDVIDRQDESGINPCDYRDPYAPSAPYNQNNDHDPNGYIEPPAPPRRFESERPADFYTDRSNTPTPTRAHNRERTSRDPRTVGRSHTPTDKHGKPPKKGKGSKKAKVGLSIFCVLLALIIILVGCATGVLGKITYHAHKENEYVTASNLKSDPRVKNVLLLGENEFAQLGAGKVLFNTSIGPGFDSAALEKWLDLPGTRFFCDTRAAAGPVAEDFFARENVRCANVSAGRTKQAFVLLSKKVLDNIRTALGE